MKISGSIRRQTSKFIVLASFIPCMIYSMHSNANCPDPSLIRVENDHFVVNMPEGVWRDVNPTYGVSPSGATLWMAIGVINPYDSPHNVKQITSVSCDYEIKNPVRKLFGLVAPYGFIYEINGNNWRLEKHESPPFKPTQYQICMYQPIDSCAFNFIKNR
ncbi:MAG: hypothetical protein V4591_11130 [Bdellovibrionota bacterium]